VFAWLQAAAARAAAKAARRARDFRIGSETTSAPPQLPAADGGSGPAGTIKLQRSASADSGDGSGASVADVLGELTQSFRGYQVEQSTCSPCAVQ